MFRRINAVEHISTKANETGTERGAAFIHSKTYGIVNSKRVLPGSVIKCTGIGAASALAHNLLKFNLMRAHGSHNSGGSNFAASISIDNKAKSQKQKTKTKKKYIRAQFGTEQRKHLNKSNLNGSSHSSFV